MPRRRRFDTEHERVVPLSLSEVQIVVSNSIDGDSVDEEAIGRALQGYQLLIQGGLRDSSRETTRMLHDQGGFHRNLLQSVAHMFGIRQLESDAPVIVRNNFSDEEADKSETSDDESIMRKLKRPRPSEGHNNSRPSTSNRDKDTDEKQPNSRENPLSDDNLVTEREDRTTPELTTPGVDNPADMVSARPTQMVSDAVRRDSNMPSSVPQPPRTSLPQTTDTVLPSNDGEALPSKTPFTTDKHNRLKTSTTDGQYDSIKPASNGGSTSPVSTQQIVTNQEKSSNLRSHSKIKEDSAPSSSAAQTFPPAQNDTLKDGGVTEPAPRVPHELPSSSQEKIMENCLSRTNEDADQGRSEKHEMNTDVNDKNGVVMVDLQGTVREKVDGKNRNELEEPLQPQTGKESHNHKSVATNYLSPTKSASSKVNMKAEDIFNIAETMLRDKNFILFFDPDAVNALEEKILPGTWMSNHKFLGIINFLEPERSNEYYILLPVNNTGGSTQESERWQLLLIKGIKRHCSTVRRSDSPVPDMSYYVNNPSIFVFESSEIGIRDETVLCVWNILNGIFRLELRRLHKTRNLKRFEMDRINHMLHGICGNVVLVRMPTSHPNTSVLAAAHTLATIQYLSKDDQLQQLLSKHSYADPARSRTCVFSYGRKQTVLNVTLRTIKATEVYGERYFQPFLALA